MSDHHFGKPSAPRRLLEQHLVRMVALSAHGVLPIADPRKLAWANEVYLNWNLRESV